MEDGEGLSAARQIARERAGKDATPEEVEAAMPRGEPIPPTTDPDAATARTERRDRALRPGTSR